jgi:hypothetical protein
MCQTMRSAELMVAVWSMVGFTSTANDDTMRYLILLVLVAGCSSPGSYRAATAVKVAHTFIPNRGVWDVRYVYDVRDSANALCRSHDSIAVGQSILCYWRDTSADTLQH